MVLFFDTELMESVESVGGWEAAKSGMAGMSAAITLSEFGGRVRIYDGHTVNELGEALEQADLIVSFNGTGFDLPLISSLMGRPIKPRKHLDLCEEIFRAVDKPAHGVWSLDAICRRTLGRGKAGSGAFAPTLAQTGRWGELFDYCLGDVYLLRDLYDHIAEVGWIMGLDDMQILVPKIQEKILECYAA